MFNKIVIYKYLDKFSLVVELIGVVNIVINDNGVLIGIIIDGVGYMRFFKERGFDVIGKKMIIVGVGGVVIVIEV